MSNRTLGDVVANRTFISAPGSSSVRDAAIRMAESQVGAILVVDDERLVGIFTERDLLNRVMARRLDPDSTPLSAVMTPDPRAEPPELLLSQALVTMYEGCYRHLPVVEDGRLLGVVSARDAMGEDLIEFERELTRRDKITEIII